MGFSVGGAVGLREARALTNNPSGCFRPDATLKDGPDRCRGGGGGGGGGMNDACVVDGLFESWSTDISMVMSRILSSS